MKLTIEENPEAIKRYGRIKPAPHRGSAPCSARCPGTLRNCTLKRGHAGPHVSHGMFRRVLAVWDKGIETGRPRAKADRVVRPNPHHGSWAGETFAALKVFGRALIKRASSMEGFFLLVLAVSMVGFALDWALRILGWR